MEKLKKFLIYFLLFAFGLTFARHFLEYPFVAMVFIGMVVFLAYKFDLPRFGLWLFLGSLILRIIIIILFDTPIISDYATQFKTAKEIIYGNFNAAANSEYMLRWGYQMGYTLFMVLLMLISEGSFLIKLVNCFFTSLIVLFVYLIAKEFTNKKVARIISVLYAFFPFPLFFNTILSNQHISSFLFLLAIYIFISKKTKNMNDKFKFFLIGLCLSIGNIIRPEAIVFIFSILLYMILTIKKYTIRRTFKCFAILIVTYFILTTSASTIAMKTGISPSGFENKEPLWKIAVGFNWLNKGDYSSSLADVFFDLDDDEQMQVVMDYTVGSIEKLPFLFLYKEQHFWLDNELNWSLGYLTNKNIHILDHRIPFNNIRAVLDSINQLYLYVIFILGFFGIFLNRNKMSEKQFLIFIIILVYSGVYLFIECTPRYAYTAQIFMILMSTYTIEYLLQYIIKRRQNKILFSESTLNSTVKIGKSKRKMKKSSNKK